MSPEECLTLERVAAANWQTARINAASKIVAAVIDRGGCPGGSLAEAYFGAIALLKDQFRKERP
jgi:hypothetical protein